jgi:predicted amidohydrolase YtcJ
MKKGMLVSLIGLLTWACTIETNLDQLIILHNGDFLTMEPGRGAAFDAMAILEDHIYAMGSFEDLSSRYPNAAQIDLKGAAVVPGFIDSHTHAHEFGQQRLKADITGLETVEAMVDALKAFFPDPKPGEWLIGQGWDEGVWSSIGLPDRALLDEAFPNNPVRLQSLHGFAGFYNGKALEIAGIDADTPDPEVGRIIRREDGSPTGVMETLAQQLVNQHIPGETVEQAKDAILAGTKALLNEGITSIHEAGLNPTVLQAYMELADEGRLPLRVYGMVNGNDDSLMQAWFARGPFSHPSGKLDIRSIKVFYDGSLGSRTALLAAAYSDNPKAAMMTERIRPDKVRSLGKTAAEKGFQMAVHAIGDEANRRVLDLYDAALEGQEETDHRWRIEHAQVVLPDYFERVAERGYISSVQSSHAVGDSKWAEDRLGAERINRAYAWKSILEAGGRLILNSDLPGEPWTPLETLYFGVTRMTLDGKPAGGWYPNQALSTYEALQAMTLSGAYAAFMESEIGSLKSGKKADFLILDRNPITIAPEQLKDLEILQIWLDGKPIPRETEERLH